MEVPRLGIKLELQLLAYTTATATPASELCLRPSRQHQIFNPLSEAGVEPVSSWILVWLVAAESQWELPVLGILNVFLIITIARASVGLFLLHFLSIGFWSCLCVC